MTVRFLLLIRVLILAIPSMAQYPYSPGPEEENDLFYRHKVSVNGAPSTWGFLLNRDANLKWKTDSLVYHGYSRPAIQLAYDHFFLNQLSAGVLLSTQTMGMNVNYLLFQNESGQLKEFNDFSIRVIRRYWGIRVNYHFINNRNTDFYAGIRYGGVLWKIRPDISDSDLDNKLSKEFTVTLAPALAIGYRYKFRNRVGIGLETGVGTPQLFSFGADFRF